MSLLLLLNKPGQGIFGDDMPVRLVEIAFDSDPLGTPIWTDVTSDVRSLSVTTGRNQELSRFNAGRLTFVLDNLDRLYDPTFTSGAHFGDILPGKRVRVSATWNHMHRLFTGFVDSFLPSYNLDHDAIVTVSATDVTKILARTRLAGSVWEQTIRDDGRAIHWYRLSEPSTTTIAVDVAGGVDGTYIGSPQQQAPSVPIHEPDFACSFDGIDDYVELQSAAGVTGTAWSVEMWISIPSFDASNAPATLYSQDSIFIGIRPSDGTPAGAIYTNINGLITVGTTDNLDAERTHFVVTRSDNTISIYVNGALETTGMLTDTATTVSSAPPRFARGIIGTSGAVDALGIIDEVVLWDVALTLADVTLHYEAGTTPLDGQLTGERVEQILDWIGWPAIGRDIDAGLTTCQSSDLGGNAWDYLNKVAETENGAIFVDGEGKVVFKDRLHFLTQEASLFTFGDGGGTEVPFSGLDLDYGEAQVTNEARISRLGGVVRVAENSSSVTDFGPHGLSRDGLFHDTDQESQDHADYLTSDGVYGQPELRVDKIEVMPQNNSTAAFPAVLGLPLQSRATVTFNPPGAAEEISQVSLVEGVSHRVDSKVWRTEFWLSAARAEPDFLILDSTAQGRLDQDRLGY